MTRHGTLLYDNNLCYVEHTMCITARRRDRSCHADMGRQSVCVCRASTQASRAIISTPAHTTHPLSRAPLLVHGRVPTSCQLSPSSIETVIIATRAAIAVVIAFYRHFIVIAGAMSCLERGREDRVIMQAVSTIHTLLYSTVTIRYSNSNSALPADRYSNPRAGAILVRRWQPVHRFFRKECPRCCVCNVLYGNKGWYCTVSHPVL